MVGRVLFVPASVCVCVARRDVAVAHFDAQILREKVKADGIADATNTPRVPFPTYVKRFLINRSPSPLLPCFRVWSVLMCLSCWLGMRLCLPTLTTCVRTSQCQIHEKFVFVFVCDMMCVCMLCMFLCRYGVPDIIADANQKFAAVLHKHMSSNTHCATFLRMWAPKQLHLPKEISETNFCLVGHNCCIVAALLLDCCCRHSADCCSIITTVPFLNSTLCVVVCVCVMWYFLCGGCVCLCCVCCVCSPSHICFPPARGVR